MINAGDTVVLEINQPTTYEADGDSILEVESVSWGQLDQLETFEDLRKEFDKTFGIKEVKIGDTTSKQGSVYVSKENGKEVRNGNTSLSDAFRNKTFVTKYWEDSDIQDKMPDLALLAYADADDDYSKEAVLNSYFNLFGSEEDVNFSATQSISREQFYTMLFKANNSYRDIDYSPNGDSFTEAVGGQSEYTKYAKEVAEYGFLQAENKSLDGSNINKSISRAEAIYMIANYMFESEVKATSSDAEAFSDTKNGGDLALDVGFKEKGKDGKIENKERWQAYTLAYMLKHPDEGMQDELYKAMALAKKLEIIKDSDSRWDETLSLSEAIDMIVNAHLAKNGLESYLTEGEYPDGVSKADKIASDAMEKHLKDKQNSEVSQAMDCLTRGRNRFSESVLCSTRRLLRKLCRNTLTSMVSAAYPHGKSGRTLHRCCAVENALTWPPRRNR